MVADEDLHRHAVENLVRADALLFGRVTYEMMEAAWRPAARPGARPDWMEPFARTIDAARKYVCEVHPEVSFFFLNGERPMSASKRKADGQAARLSVLRKWAGETMGDALAGRRELDCKADDIVDALVALWTAERIGRASCRERV